MPGEYTKPVLSNEAAQFTMEACQKGLKTLGYHPVTQRHAFLELSIPSLGAEDVSILQSFPNIMYLDVSNNAISSLKVLEHFHGLIQLRARNNKLTECLNFSPPHCKESQSWPEGERAIGSMLTLVDLSQNSIRRIGDLSNHRFLECLLLSKNQLGWIEGLHNLRFLQTLDLSGNKIAQIEGLDNLPLRELRIANNELTTLDGLDKLPCLCSLDVSNNQIKTLAQVQSLIHLTYLDVSGNSLAFIRQVEYLTACNWLHVLLIDRNPCAFKLHYRLRVLYRLPNLKRLDHVLVSTEEKMRALNLYRSAEGDVHLRQQIWQEYCPTVPFEDFSPQQLQYDEENDITADEMLLGELLLTSSFEAASTAVGNASSYQAPEMGAQVLEASAVEEMLGGQEEKAPGGMVLESASSAGLLGMNNNQHQDGKRQGGRGVREATEEEGSGDLGEASRVYQENTNNNTAAASEGGFYGGDFDQIEEIDPSTY